MALKTLSLLFIVTFLMSHSALAREFPRSYDLAARLDSEGNDCWTALAEIRSCTNEIVAYFTNGTIDISPPCCQAIGVITHQCWPSMLSMLGFTPDETYILRGYCDATAASAADTSPFLGPVPTPSVQPSLLGNSVGLMD